MEILWFIVFGFVVGLIARFVTPGRGPGGFLVTAAIGMAGSLIGGLLGRYALGRGDNYVPGWIMSILGAVILIALVRVLTRKAG